MRVKYKHPLFYVSESLKVDARGHMKKKFFSSFTETVPTCTFFAIVYSFFHFFYSYLVANFF